MSVPPNSILAMLRGGLDRAVNGAPSPYLEPDEQKAVNAQRRQAMIAALLQGAAPRPQGTGNTLGDIGNALAAGNRAQGAGLDDAMKARLTGMQIQQMRAQSIAAQQRADAATAAAAKPHVSVVNGALVTDGGQVIYKAPDKPADTSEMAKKAADAEKLLGRPLTPEETLKLFGIAPSDKADEQDKPLSATDLSKLRAADGSQFPFGTTARQASQAGAHTISEAEIGRQAAAATALNTFSELKNLALGPNGVFNDNGGSALTNNVPARALNGISNSIGNFVGTEAGRRRTVYSSTSAGALASIARALGESGSLAVDDVKRAQKLLAELGSLPETKETAELKFNELESLIRKGMNGSPTAAKSSPAAGPKFLGFE